MKIALLGDIALLGAFSLENNKHLMTKLQDISDYLASFDYVVGNLETPFSVKRKRYGAKSAYICADPINVKILKHLHIDAVSIANNHMYDFGKEGLNTTITELEKAGIGYFGIDGKDFTISTDNNAIVFNGFCCYSTNPLKIAAKYGRKGINRFNLDEAIAILKKNEQNEQLNIFAVHSGIEHTNRPSIDQINAARRLADCGNYIFYGHHPHVIQGVERYKGSLIAHSLGNFCFDGGASVKELVDLELSENNRHGIILEVTIEDNEIIDYKETAIYIGDGGSIRILDDNSCIHLYNSYIKEAFEDSATYNKLRDAQRNEFITTRKKRRNLKWYIRHLQVRYARLLISGYMNAIAYKRNIKDLV